MSQRIRITQFGGEVPALDGRVLPEGKAQTARDVRVGYGRMEPLSQNGNPAISVGASAQTIALYNRDANGGNGFWLEWDTDVDVLPSPVVDDVHGRVYWTGDGAPKMSVAAIITQAPPYPANQYLLGIPAPTAAPSVAVDPGADPDAIATSVTYVVTYVSAYGEEGPPSPATNVVDRPDGHGVTLSAIPVAPIGNYNISTKRIYRSSGGDFLLVAELAIATATLNDTVTDAALGVAMESLNYDPPDAAMIGLMQHPAGFMVGWKGNELCASEAYLPHAWPVGYRITTERPITGAAITSAGIVVGTESTPYLAIGSSPDALQLIPIDEPQACVSKRSMVDMGDYALYASPDGLVAGGGSNPRVVTDGLFTRKQWQALVPSSIHAYRYDGRYVAFHTGGAFIFNPQTGDVTTLTDTAACAVYDAIRDQLYLVNGGVLSTFDSESGNRTALWRSRKYQSSDQTPYGAVRVDADAYPVTLRLYGDGNLVATKLIEGFEIERLPTDRRYRTTEIELESAHSVHSVDMAMTVTELMQ